MDAVRRELAPNDAFVRKAALVRVVDGDTYEMRVDLGYRVEGRFLIRVRDLNTPELPTFEGVIAKEKATHIFASAGEIVVRSFKDTQTFARWVADVYIDGESMAVLMTTPDPPHTEPRQGAPAG